MNAGDNAEGFRAKLPGFLREVGPGEGRIVGVFFLHAFLLLVCYYILKTLREPLLLDEGSAELKSYAYATIACLLLVLVPVYGAVFSRCKCRRRLFQHVTGFFVLSLGAFCLAGRLGFDVGFVYYVWVGILGVTMLAQFWSYAADVFDVASGQRLFPAVAAGAALGGLAGPPIVGALFGVLGPWMLLLTGGALLLATLPLIRATPRIPAASTAGPSTRIERRCPPEAAHRWLGGLALVLRDRYLLLLALFVVLLNCINSTGEYLLTSFVVQNAEARLELDPSLSRAELVAGFYGSFYLAVNVLTFLTQALLVARVFRSIGVGGALLVLPIIALLGYGLIFLVPIFGLVRFIKLLENSADYSLTNTSRHALYLPLSPPAKYEGKLAIDTFFCRFGDLLHAGIVFLGVNWLALSLHEFALVNVLLSVAWLVVATRLGLRYNQAARSAQSAADSSVTATVRPLASPRPWHVPPSFGRRAAALCLAGMLGAVGLVVPRSAGAAEPLAEAEAGLQGSAQDVGATERLFDSHGILELDAYIDLKALCRNPNRSRCHDEPMTLVYSDRDGLEHRLETTVRSRGRYREETGNCRFPALFVFFGEDTAGTLFDGESMLPLTTHCQHRPRKYEEYVLREYLAYRIYNHLTDKSLRVRLAQVTYHDLSGRRTSFTRYGFFTEHFESLARRHDAEVYEPGKFDLSAADPKELAVHDLFQYMIGNTDFSVVYGHNIFYIRDRGNAVTVVPYDFDFSGLVDAEYASPSPLLKIRHVTDREFRGICDAGSRRHEAVQHFEDREHAINALLQDLLREFPPTYDEPATYVDSFFEQSASREQFLSFLSSACR